MELNSPKHILLVEDTASYIQLIIEALSEKITPDQLHIVQDGAAALQFLYRQDSYQTSPIPSLILLDLHLPKVNGYEVLGTIKSDPDLKKIPVVVFSSSSSEADIHKCYSLYANCYITKPLDLDDFFAVIQEIIRFWLTIVKLP